MGSRSRRYKQWLAEFKDKCRLIAEPSDELDGWLNTGDFRNYYEEGRSASDAAENEVGMGV